MGLAETNSTCNVCPAPRSIAPQESGAASTASTCARFQSGDSRRLMKPGGATSTAAISAPVRSESAIARATSSGARLTVPARRSATLLA